MNTAMSKTNLRGSDLNLTSLKIEKASSAICPDTAINELFRPVTATTVSTNKINELTISRL